ncbi:uncharacterized protein METZ01_LOCUS5720 [marine metagenome]|uniref:Uncharacterized protein n=1 Tax=marine metagenome TaxID=408172 RepID=A0A381NE53_9ZZZZ
MAHNPIVEFGHISRPHRTQLVEPRLAVYDERADMTEFSQRLDDKWNERGVGNADQLPAHTGGVRQRTENVHDGRETQLPADRSHVAHRRMEQRREHEYETDLFKDPSHLLRAEFNADV